MPKLHVFIEITDEERENFLTRLAGGAVLSGEIDRKLTVSVTGDDDEGPENLNAGTTDKFGVAWDARYHGKAKNTNQDGSWKRIKGLSDALKAEADAYEATQKAAAAVAPVVTEAAPVVAAPVAAPVAVVAEATAPVVGLPLPVAPAAETALPGLPLPVAPVVPAPISYDEVVALFTKAATANPAVAANYAQIYADCGITDPNALRTDETLRRKLADKLNEYLPAAA